MNSPSFDAGLIRKEAFLGSYRRDAFYRRQSFVRAFQSLITPNKSPKPIGKLVPAAFLDFRLQPGPFLRLKK